MPIDCLYDRIFRIEKKYQRFTNHGINIVINGDESQKICFGNSRIIWLDNQRFQSRTMYDIALALYNHYERISNELYRVEPLDIAFNKIIFVSHKPHRVDTKTEPCSELNKTRTDAKQEYGKDDTTH
jgi:hypothetical protein